MCSSFTFKLPSDSCRAGHRVLRSAGLHLAVGNGEGAVLKRDLAGESWRTPSERLARRGRRWRRAPALQWKSAVPPAEFKSFGGRHPGERQAVLRIEVAGRPVVVHQRGQLRHRDLADDAVAHEARRRDGEVGQPGAVLVAAEQVGAQLVNSQLAGREFKRSVHIAGGHVTEVEMRARKSGPGPQLRQRVLMPRPMSSR